MSLETDIKLGSLERGKVRYFPVVPGRVEFAAALRRLLLTERPQIVAVELPGFLEPAYTRALQRLPEMSVILCTASSSEGEDERPVYHPVNHQTMFPGIDVRNEGATRGRHMVERGWGDNSHLILKGS